MAQGRGGPIHRVVVAQHLAEVRRLAEGDRVAQPREAVAQLGEPAVIDIAQQRELAGGVGVVGVAIADVAVQVGVARAKAQRVLAQPALRPTDVAPLLLRTARDFRTGRVEDPAEDVASLGMKGFTTMSCCVILS
jgi:hypothetical protein